MEPRGNRYRKMRGKGRLLLMGLCGSRVRSKNNLGGSRIGVILHASIK